MTWWQWLAPVVGLLLLGFLWIFLDGVLRDRRPPVDGAVLALLVAVRQAQLWAAVLVCGPDVVPSRVLDTALDPGRASPLVRRRHLSGARGLPGARRARRAPGRDRIPGPPAGQRRRPDAGRDAEIDRLPCLGATLAADHRDAGWAVLLDPAGNGNRFEVERFGSREEADGVAATVESGRWTPTNADGWEVMHLIGARWGA